MEAIRATSDLMHNGRPEKAGHIFKVPEDIDLDTARRLVEKGLASADLEVVEEIDVEVKTVDGSDTDELSEVLAPIIKDAVAAGADLGLVEKDEGDPGGSDADPARIGAIKEVIAGLPDEAFNKDGTPNAAALDKAFGEKVSADERKEAFAAYEAEQKAAVMETVKELITEMGDDILDDEGKPSAELISEYLDDDVSQAFVDEVHALMQEAGDEE